MEMILDYNDLQGNPDESESVHELRLFLFFSDLLLIRLENKKPNVSDICFQLNQLFKILNKLSSDEQFFWDYCPSLVYEKTYDKRLRDFCENNIELSEIDFIEIERNEILRNIRPDGFYLHYNVINVGDTKITQNTNSIQIDFLDHTQFSTVKAATKKKLSFLSDKLGYKIDCPEIEYVHLIDKIKSTDNQTNDNDESLSSLTPPEKFVMIHELGIIDFLKSKINVGYNDTILAKLLSTFTDVNAENMRKMLGGAKNGDHNNKITENSIADFENRLRSLKIDPSFFRNKQSKSNK